MKKKTLVIEIDITDVHYSWTVAIQMAQFELMQGIERQLILKRTSQDKLICVPDPGPDNFVKSVIVETHE